MRQPANERADHRDGRGAQTSNKQEQKEFDAPLRRRYRPVCLNGGSGDDVRDLRDGRHERGRFGRRAGSRK